MSFVYTPIASEEEAQKAREFPLLPDGIYDFIVTENKLTHSKNGNPMIQLKLKISHDGQEFNVFDNLIAVNNMMWKTKHFCETVGLEKEYLAAKFNERMCAGKRGTCAIKTLPARPKNDGTGGFYKAKNEVEDYLTADKINSFVPKTSNNAFAAPNNSVPPPPVEEDFLNEEIPF